MVSLGDLDLSENINGITIRRDKDGLKLPFITHILGDIVEIKLTAKHGELSDEIQETMKAKVAKLPRFFDRTTGIQVLADLKHSEPKVEIIVSAEEANDFFASDTGTNVIVALDSTIAKIEQQLKKHNEKIKTGNRNRDHKNPENIADGEE